MPRTLLPAGLAFFVLVTTPLVAGAQSGPNESPSASPQESPDRGWSARPRTVQVHQTLAGFDFESRAEDALLVGDALAGHYELGTGRFLTQLHVSAAEPPVAVLADVQFLALYEFQDADRDGHFDAGDPVLERVPLGEMESSPVQVRPRLGGGYDATARYLFNVSQRGGDLPGPGSQETLPATLRLDWSFVTTPQDARGTIIAPTTIPLRLTVEEYPFQNATSLLASEWKLRSDRPLEGDGPRLSARIAEFAMAVGWDSFARVGGGAAPVGWVASHESASGGAAAPPAERVLRFAYPQAGVLEHGLGVEAVRYAPLAEGSNPVGEFVLGNPFVYTMAILVAAVATAIPAWRRLRHAP